MLLHFAMVIYATNCRSRLSEEKCFSCTESETKGWRFFKGTLLSSAAAILTIWNPDNNSAKGPMGLTYTMSEWLAELVAKILF